MEHKADASRHDEIALHLFAFLASWGMVRGSTFLLQKDYKFLLPIVEELCKKEYDCLAKDDILQDGFDSEQFVAKVLQLKDKIEQSLKGTTYYRNKKKDETDDEPKTVDNISDTLITKILLGTFGCVPAYDTYFKNTLAELNITQKLGKNSLTELITTVQKSNRAVKAMQAQVNAKTEIEYPVMKIIDMAFWQNGKK